MLPYFNDYVNLFVKVQDLCNKKGNIMINTVIDNNIIYEDYGNIFLDDFVDCWPKEASRGVIQFSDGDILVFLKERIGQYKLPGGGKENNS